MDWELIIVVLTLGSLGLLFYSYAVYPPLLWFLSLFARRDEGEPVESSPRPEVSILISAYNEEKVIAERIRNLLELDYPKERLEILIGSDGSTDRTAEIARRYQAQRVRLIAFKSRRGKASVLNDLVSLARGEVVVLTDANVFFQPDVVRELVKALWRHPSACTVVGCLELRSSMASGNFDGIYWRYETWLKRLESRFGAVPGANGAIYAFRRERYQSIPKNAIADDILIPMLMRLHSGGKVFFVPSAKAWELSPESVRDEFRRRVRMGAGDLPTVIWTWRLLLPWKGMAATTYFSHKVLRWFGPWLMLIGFVGSLSLRDHAFFEILFLAQTLFYGLGVAGRPLRRVPILGLVALAVRYFLILNAGLLIGYLQLGLGLARPVWETAPRRA